MADIFDYIDWRGDLPLSVVPFNEVDALVLSRVSYMPLDGIVPMGFSGGVTLAHAAERFIDTGASYNALMAEDIRLAAALTESARFGNMLLTGFVNEFEPKEQKQFCALTIAMENGVHCISFRGTDSTLVGWKEDFNMSFCENVPSQLVAVKYLEAAAGAIEGRLVTCGHSKGGNLAVYSAAFCSKATQERIDAVYNNDGPGLFETVVKAPEYLRISGKIHTFVPQTSVIGMLLERKEKYSVVHSTENGLLQHNVYTWETQRDTLVHLKGLNKSSRFIDSTIKEWVASHTVEERGRFIDCVFELAAATEANTLHDLTDRRLKNAAIMLKSYRKMDDETRSMMTATLSVLIRCARENVSIVIPRKSKPAQSTALGRSASALSLPETLRRLKPMRRKKRGN